MLHPKNAKFAKIGFGLSRVATAVPAIEKICSKRNPGANPMPHSFLFNYQNAYCLLPITYGGGLSRICVGLPNKGVACARLMDAPSLGIQPFPPPVPPPRPLRSGPGAGGGGVGPGI